MTDTMAKRRMVTHVRMVAVFVWEVSLKGVRLLLFLATILLPETLVLALMEMDDVANAVDSLAGEAVMM